MVNRNTLLHATAIALIAALLLAIPRVISWAYHTAFLPDVARQMGSHAHRPASYSPACPSEVPTNYVLAVRTFEGKDVQETFYLADMTIIHMASRNGQLLQLTSDSYLHWMPLWPAVAAIVAGMAGSAFVRFAPLHRARGRAHMYIVVYTLVIVVLCAVFMLTGLT